MSTTVVTPLIRSSASATAHGGDRALPVVVEDGQELVERAVPEAGAAGLVGDALAQRLAGRMGVNVDEARERIAARCSRPRHRRCSVNSSCRETRSRCPGSPGRRRAGKRAPPRASSQATTQAALRNTVVSIDLFQPRMFAHRLLDTSSAAELLPTSCRACRRRPGACHAFCDGLRTRARLRATPCSWQRSPPVYHCNRIDCGREADGQRGRP